MRARRRPASSTTTISSTRSGRTASRSVDYVFSPHSRGNIEDYAEILRPFGEIVAIDEPEGLDLLPLKSKSIAWHWELMFTRSMFETPDMIEQKHLLSRVAELVDEGAGAHDGDRERSPTSRPPGCGARTSWSSPGG